MPLIRPTRPVSGWWSPNHAPSKLSAEPPVTSAQPLWRLVKDGHVAEARVRPLEGVGVELRYHWDDELRVSQVFKAWDALEAATQKRRELEARGWHSALVIRRPTRKRTEVPVAFTTGRYAIRRRIA